jgi:Tol biopolymer transport system component
MRLNGSRTVVANGGWPFAWNPDGSSVAYLMGTEGAGLSDLYIDRGGQSRKVDSVPVPRGIGCESRTCADAWDVRMIYSPNGAYISLNYVPGVGVFRIWTADGRVLKSMDSSRATMSVWSGDSFYWRDEKGVERWRDGQQSLVLPGVSWIRPHASPAGGQIVYETRDAGIGKAHVYLLDTASGNTRELKTSRSEPAFLNSHLISYKEERPCASGDGWPCSSEATTIETGKTYIYDLQDNTETESVIAAVFDVWPHAA